MSYLLVDGVEGAAFVLVAGGVDWSDWLQLVNIAPITSPMSTIKANFLFIICQTFIKSAKSTSKILDLSPGVKSPGPVAPIFKPRCWPGSCRVHQLGSQPAGLLDQFPIRG